MCSTSASTPLCTGEVEVSIHSSDEWIFPGDDLNALDVGRPILDCNGTGIEDSVDIALGGSADTDGNGIPDECIFSYCYCVAGAPCGNTYPFGGCTNSTGMGAILTGTGSTSIGADTLVLSATQLPPNKFGMIYRGTTQLPNIPFNDGQRCVGGNIRRHLVRNSGAAGIITEGPGYIALTNALTPPAGNILPGVTWTFQCWYRDGMGPCGTSANLSNGVSVLFTP